MSLIFYGGQGKAPMRGGNPTPAQQATNRSMSRVLLKLYDTIHDFWFDDRHAHSGQTPIIRKLINSMYTVQLGLTVTDPLNPDPNQSVTIDFASLSTMGARSRVAGKLSNFERNVAEFMGDKWPVDFRSAGRMTLTYEEILNDMRGPPSASPARGGPILTRLRGNRDKQSILEIDNGSGREIKSMSTSERNTVAEFILRYLFPGGPDEENTAVNAARGVSYDMSPGRVDDIFTGVDQIFNALYPTNFADSAGTSLQSARNRYVWPDIANLKPPSPAPPIPPPPPPPRADYVAESNIYTAGEVEFRIVDRGYSHKNPYGFTVRLVIAGKPGCWPATVLDFPFSSTHTTGPPVIYLCNIIEEMDFIINDPIRARRVVPTSASNSKIISLQPLVDWVHSVLPGPCRTLAAELVQRIALDWKREGDYGQMRAPAASDLTCSGDILCAEARKINQARSGFWQNGNKLEVFRFPVVPANETPDITAAREYRYWSENNLARLQYIRDITANPPLLAESVNNFRVAATGGVYSRKTTREQVNVALGRLPAVTHLDLADGPMRIVCEDLVSTALLRILAGQRLMTATAVAVEIGSFPAVWGAAAVPAANPAEAVTRLEAASNWVIPPETSNQAAAIAAEPNPVGLRLGIDRALSNMPTTLGLTISRNKDGALVLDTSLFSGSPQFSKTASSALFDFSVGRVDVIARLYAKLISIVYGRRYNAATESPEVAELRMNVSNELIEKLKSFVEYAGNQPWVQGGVSEPEGWGTALKTSLSTVDVTGVGTQVFVTQLPAMLLGLVPPSPLSGGGPMRRSDPEVIVTKKPSNSYYINVGQRFRAICARASQDINAIITERGIGNGMFARYIRLITDASTACTQTLNFLGIEWESFIDEMKNDERYVYIPSVTTDFISLLLSLRLSTGGVGGAYAEGPLVRRFPKFVGRNMTIVNDMIGGITSPPPPPPPGMPPLPDHTDVDILIILAMSDRVISGRTGEFTYFGSFPPSELRDLLNFKTATMTKSDWDGIPNLLQTAALSLNGAILEKGVLDTSWPMIPIADQTNEEETVTKPKPPPFTLPSGGRKTHRRRGLPKLV